MEQIDKKQLAVFVEAMYNWLESKKQKMIRISEKISSNGLNYDRHFTSASQFTMTIERVLVRVSGVRLGVYSDDYSNQYEINAYAIFLGEIEDDTLTVVEKLAGKHTRRSTITLIQD